MDITRSVSKHFSRASSMYDQEGSLHRELAKKVCERITLGTTPGRILDLGCGTGFLTKEIRDRFPDARIDAIDLAQGMTREAQRNFPDDSRVSLIVGDARTYCFNYLYDLVVSSSAIQWMAPHQMLFENVFRVLQPGGSFCFSCMLRGTLDELHCLRREIAPEKQPRAELPSAEQLDQELGQAGFSCIESTEESYRESYCSAEDFVKKIRVQGFTGGELSVGSKLLTRGELERLLERYQSLCSLESGGVFATYQVGFFEGKKT